MLCLVVAFAQSHDTTLQWITLRTSLESLIFISCSNEALLLHLPFMFYIQLLTSIIIIAKSIMYGGNSAMVVKYTVPKLVV